MGIVSAAGSLGALVSAPLGQMLNEGFGWRVGVAGFVVLSLFMLPAAWYAGRADRIPCRRRPRTTSATLRRQQPRRSLSAIHRSW
jgi:predicted MFS family arabinose efflux permease